MDQPERDAAAVRFPPPLVPLIAVLAGCLLHAFAPLRLELALVPRIVVSLSLLLLGGALVAAAFGRFQQTRQDPAPWKPTPELISGGIYRFTRNPMYVGMGLAQAGIGVGLANGWILLAVPLVWATIYWIAIRYEEAYLERKFGDAYLRYKRTVRRWL